MSLPKNRISSLKPDEGELPEEIQELEKAVSSLPSDLRKGLDPIVREVIKGTQRRIRKHNLRQIMLSELWLDRKFLVFDIEATCRERDEYCRRLEELKRNT